MLKGEIYLIDLGTGIGSEQCGKRPCLIVQNNSGNKYSSTLIVAPITTKSKGYGATHMSISCLLCPSTIMFEQVRTVSKDRVIKYLAVLTDAEMENVNFKLKLAMDL